jgi:uncharacterized protein (DUF488 family)
MAEELHRRTVFTIGHSNHDLDRFLALLKRHAVSAVADVRSVPFSRAQPQFNRPDLARALKTAGVEYVFLGRELGARSDDDTCYVDGRVRYRRLAETELFRSGLQRVQRGSERHRVALMCAERDPLTCHRTLLVSRELEAAGTPVEHIHGDGRLESHGAAMLRLVESLGLAAGDLFHPEQDLIRRAYDLQEESIAYVRRRPLPESSEVVS